MRYLRKLVIDFTPPIVLRAIRRMRGVHPHFEGDYTSWEEASEKCSGYNAKNILVKVLEATLKVKSGDAVFERDSVLFDEIEYAWPVLSGLMWAAARNGGKLNVLDFGGSLGSSYFQNRKFLEDLPEVRWNIVEQEHYVQAGQEHIQDDYLRFYPTIDACLAENKPNVVLLSSVLQYLKSPSVIIDILTSVGANSLIIDRSPFSLSNRNKLVIQNVSASIYEASYPMWIFSGEKFDKMLMENWNLVARNLSPEGRVKTAGNFEFSFQGMLLEARR